jgi:hypothetical protein
LAATKLDWAEDRGVDKLVGLCDAPLLRAAHACGGRGPCRHGGF